MDTAEFDYELPADRIAQRPIEPRDGARLLVDHGPGAPATHHIVSELPALLEPGDLLVMNDTRVLPARLVLRKQTGGQAEVFVLGPAPEDDGRWRALVRPGRRLPPGTILYTTDGPGLEDVPVVEIGEIVDPDGDDGIRLVRLLSEADDIGSGLLERWGEVPLPPYITVPLADAERYQTVYARRARSVAAPTAGLHLTEDVLSRCRNRGVVTAFVELEVGLGTFRPIGTDKVDEHHMHGEHYRVPAATMDACERAERVVAVGTTTVRALESAVATGELSGRTELFIRRPFPFRVVDGLLTNFHLPRSSLLVMIDAFVGSRWRSLYGVALDADYRFLSFGDAMLLRRTEGP